jgi:hypothetical protein
MAVLNRAAILAAPVQTREIEAPELGGTVRLRAFTPRTRTELLDVVTENTEAVKAYEADQAKDEDARDGVAPVKAMEVGILQLLFTIVDEDNQRVFGLDDYEAIRDLPYALIQELYSNMIMLENRQNHDALKKSSEQMVSDVSSSD